jgi:predicted MPP superfamily phosphohydrolase
MHRIQQVKAKDCPSSVPNISRRKFLKRLILSTALAGAGGAFYSAVVEPRLVHVRRMRIPVQRLPKALDGLTIAHLTDLHRSRVISAEFLAKCIVMANGLSPDIMVFTGDYLTHHDHFGRLGDLFLGERLPPAEFARQCAECMSRARAKHGVFASLGNHDHWFDANVVTKTIESAGIPVLRNENRTVQINGEPLAIVGLGDLWTEGVNITRAFRNVDSTFSIVLMHNPDSFEHWPREGSHLILAGHTHGGQVNIPLLGPPLVPSRYGQRYAHGLFVRGETHMYVNSGLGMIPPAVRFNCPPEIALLQLQKA